MNILQAIILSIVEGFTEFLPISSTGHLILASKLLNISPTEFTKTFEIAIQLGAICSVLAFYTGTLVAKPNLIYKIITSFVPTAVVGFIFYPLVKNVFLESTAITLIALLVGGVFIIIFELVYQRRSGSSSIKSLSYTQAFFIGVAQSVSIVPGVSRAAATIFGSMFLGLDRKAAVEYSFLLAVPTMTAATALDLYKSASSFNQTNMIILVVGFITSFFVALLSIKFLLGLVKRSNFVFFGVYRIILAILFFLFLI